MAWDWEKLQKQKKQKQGGQPPEMGDLLEKLKDLKANFRGPLIVIVIAILVLLGITCVYTVGVNEVGVVQRFGEFVRTKVETEEFGFRTLEAGIRTRYAADSAYLNESLMLTGDLNVAVVPWVVQYNIKDAGAYLFKVRNVNATLRDLAESTMRQVIGDRSITEVINKREEIANQARETLQQEVDNAETGINITALEMQKTNVPEPVQSSFNQVNQAVQEKETMVYEAQKEKNKIIPQALGQAFKTISEAEGYALDRVNRAQGDAARFNALYEEYSKAKDITKRRLYLETIQEVFPNLGEKYIVDDELNNLLPLLNLGQRQGGVK
ncbi:MAG: FtsH protease activity modulator HflK [Deltaproteobacteria bacterium]|nr:FtsH protease activity modulator HflK [Deltaproteobacteria bacterium]